jgi:hypothetical protein
MFYILGGAPRAGKSILAKKFLKEKQVPYLSTDAIVGMLSQSAPEYGIQQGGEFIPKAQKLWRFSKALFEYLIEEEENYLVEGDAILPEQVMELIKDYPNDIKTCFVGFHEISPEEKLRLIRTFKQEIDWTDNHSDDQMMKYVNMMIPFSKYLKGECLKYNLKFFDISKDFEKVHKEIYDYLVN